MQSIWNSTEIVSLLAERVSGKTRAKEIFHLCELLDQTPLHKKRWKEYAELAVEDYWLGTLERSEFSMAHFFRVFEDIACYFGDRKQKRRLVEAYKNRVPKLKEDNYIHKPSNAAVRIRHGGEIRRLHMTAKDITDYREAALNTLRCFILDLCSDS